MQLLKPFTFSDSRVKLLAFACGYCSLDPEVKTYLLSVCLNCVPILFVDECRHFQVIAVRPLYQICICKLIRNLQLVASSYENRPRNPLDLDLIEALKPVGYPILLQWNTCQFFPKMQFTVFLNAFFHQRNDSLFILVHPRHYRLFLLRRENFKRRHYLLLVPVEMPDFADMRRIDLVQLLSVLMDIKNVVVEPFALNKELRELLALRLVQPFLDDFAFEDLADLVLAFRGGSQQSGFYRSLLRLRAAESPVCLFRHADFIYPGQYTVFTRFCFFQNIL